MKLAAIIQARSNSNRLKDKMSLELSHNKKIFEWVLIRAIRSKKIKNFILATTNNKRDKILIKIAKKYNLKIFKGNEKDVLRRFYDCSKKLNLKTIVRVCADNPLIDSKEIDRLVMNFVTCSLSDSFFESLWAFSKEAKLKISAPKPSAFKFSLVCILLYK